MSKPPKGPKVREYTALMEAVKELHSMVASVDRAATGFVHELQDLYHSNEDRLKRAIRQRTLRPTCLARKGTDGRRFILFNDVKYIYGARAPDEIELDDEPKFYWTSPEGITTYATSLHDALLSCVSDFLNPVRNTPNDSLGTSAPDAQPPA